MSDTIITVEGHFDYHHPAERGIVLLSAGFEGADRAAVVSRTTATHSSLTNEAQKLVADGAVTWWSADRMRVWADRPWNQDGKQLPLVHHASVALEVKFSNLSTLAEWAETVATREGVTVGGIRWALTEVTRARTTAEAQHRAVQDAVARATAYATSLGLSTLRTLALADPGMLGDSSHPQTSTAHDAAPMLRSVASAPAGPALDLKPEDITVTRRVHARFAAS